MNLDTLDGGDGILSVIQVWAAERLSFELSWLLITARFLLTSGSSSSSRLQPTDAALWRQTAANWTPPKFKSGKRLMTNRLRRMHFMRNESGLAVNSNNPRCFLSRETSAMVTRMRTTGFANKHGGGDEDGRRGGRTTKSCGCSSGARLRSRTERHSVALR